jgi:hypothetical protein
MITSIIFLHIERNIDGKELTGYIINIELFIYLIYTIITFSFNMTLDTARYTNVFMIFIITIIHLIIMACIIITSNIKPSNITSVDIEAPTINTSVDMSKNNIPR